MPKIFQLVAHFMRGVGVDIVDHRGRVETGFPEGLDDRLGFALQGAGLGGETGSHEEEDGGDDIRVIAIALGDAMPFLGD